MGLMVKASFGWTYSIWNSKSTGMRQRSGTTRNSLATHKQVDTLLSLLWRVAGIVCYLFSYLFIFYVYIKKLFY